MAFERSTQGIIGNGSTQVLMDEFNFQMDVIQSLSSSDEQVETAILQLIRLVTTTELDKCPSIVCSLATFNKLASRLRVSPQSCGAAVTSLALVLFNMASQNSSKLSSLDCFSTHFLEALVMVDARSGFNNRSEARASSPQQLSFHHKRKFTQTSSSTHENHPHDLSRNAANSSDRSPVRAVVNSVMGILGIKNARNDISELEVLQLAYINRYFYLLIDRITSCGARGVSDVDNSLSSAFGGEDDIESAEQAARSIEKEIQKLRRILAEAHKVLLRPCPRIFMEYILRDLVVRLRVFRDEASNAGGLCWLIAGIIDGACFLSSSTQRFILCSWENSEIDSHFLSHIFETIFAKIPIMLFGDGSSSAHAPALANATDNVLGDLFLDLSHARINIVDTVQCLFRAVISFFHIIKSPAQTAPMVCPSSGLIEIILHYIPALQSLIYLLGDVLHSASVMRSTQQDSLPSILSLEGPLSSGETPFEVF